MAAAAATIVRLAGEWAGQASSSTAPIGARSRAS
jgi:hypothetical protein